jgi:DNA topoisomerase-1
VQDRGYVWKKGQALVPTWTAFAVVGLMEKHFDDFVDYAFTARIDEDLDAIARNELKKGLAAALLLRSDEGAAEPMPGLKRLVAENLDHIDAAEINTFPIGLDPDGNEIVVKPGKYGPYVKRGDDTASVPDDLTPDELTVAKALSCCRPKSDEPIGELDGYPVFAKNGRYGPYVQWGTPDNLPPGLEKPKMASLFKTMTLERITLADAKELLQLPRTLGVDPADGEAIIANNGRYGPYVQKGKDFRNIADEEQLLTISLDEASPSSASRRSSAAAAAPTWPPRARCASSAPTPSAASRWWPRTASSACTSPTARPTPRSAKGDRLDAMEPERAFELLAIRREPSSSGWRGGQEGVGHQEGRCQEGCSRQESGCPRRRRQESRGQEGDAGDTRFT